MSKVILIKENPSRLLLHYFPDIQINANRFGQEDLFDIMYRYKVVGRARLQYRIPFEADKLRESQTLMVYNRLVPYVKKKFIDELGDAFTPKTLLVYLMFKWEERDLVAFEEIFKEQWDSVINENPAQHQMQLAI
jgi:hypothetical protein